MNPDTPCMPSEVCSVPFVVEYVWRAACSFSPFVFDPLWPSSPNLCWVKLSDFLNRAWFFFSRCAYWKRFNPTPSSHCRRCTLIQFVRTLDPWIHRCVECTKVISILPLTYQHVLKYGCCHFFARCMAILFRFSSTSTLSNPSMEAKKGEKCWRCWM